jgi:hypothetical protein
MIKRTFLLDQESAEYLDRMAARLGIAKSEVVREALRVHSEQLARTAHEERSRAVDAFDLAAARVPERPRAEVEAELAELSAARRGGGRRRDGMGWR